MLLEKNLSTFKLVCLFPLPARYSLYFPELSKGEQATLTKYELEISFVSSRIGGVDPIVRDNEISKPKLGFPQVSQQHASEHAVRVHFMVLWLAEDG